MTGPAVKAGIVAAANTFHRREPGDGAGGRDAKHGAGRLERDRPQCCLPDALNGAVKEACDAGVIVVSFDGIVTEPCA